MESHLLAPEVFHGKFCRDIRIGFNWRRFLLEGWSLRRVTLESPDDLSSLRLPWYRNGAGGLVDFDTADASPLVLDCVKEWLPLLPSERVFTIEKMRDEYLAGVRTTSFEFPSYALPLNRHMIMDGNHRLSALVLSKMQFKIEMWVVIGPIDPNALADTKFLFSIKP
jgi:hypothetical protein